MRRTVTLVTTSLLALVLMMVHLTQDTLAKPEGAMKYPVPVVVFALWLCAACVWFDRVWGYLVMFFGGLVAAAMIVVHAHGTVVPNGSGFGFVLTLFALSATGVASMLLCAGGIWTAWRGRGSRTRGDDAGGSTR